MMRPQRVVIVFWDGMRPDHIRPHLTPYLHAFVRHGAWYRRAVTNFPSVSHPTAATISTGTYPGKHGLHSNELPGPSDDRRPIYAGSLAEIDRLRRFNGGRLLRVATLAERLADAGRRLAVVGGGTMANLLDPERAGIGVSVTSRGAVAGVADTHSWPASLLERLTARFGPVPPLQMPIVDLDRWKTTVFTDHILTEGEVDVAVLMSGDPDYTQHRWGTGSMQARQAVRKNDALLGKVLDTVARSGIPTAVIVVSDHGHSNITDFVDFASLLAEAGLLEALRDGRLLYGDFDNEVAVERHPDGAALATRVGRLIAAQPWANLLLTWPGVEHLDIPFALPLARLWNDAQPAFVTAATFTYSLVGSAAPDRWGIPGTVVARTHRLAGFKRFPSHRPAAVGALRSMHGSLNWHDLNCTLALCGTGIRSGGIDLPAGPVDIAPTVLRLLNLPPLANADGRALTEAFVDGPAPASVAVRTEHLAAMRVGELRREVVGQSSYLDTRSEPGPW